MDASDWMVHAIGQLYLAQPLIEMDFRTLGVRHPFTMHVTRLGRCEITSSLLNGLSRIGGGGRGGEGRGDEEKKWTKKEQEGRDRQRVPC